MATTTKYRTCEFEPCHNLFVHRSRAGVSSRGTALHLAVQALLEKNTPALEKTVVKCSPIG